MGRARLGELRQQDLFPSIVGLDSVAVSNGAARPLIFRRGPGGLAS